jgi:hypothetical protein
MICCSLAAQGAAQAAEAAVARPAADGAAAPATPAAPDPSADQQRRATAARLAELDHQLDEIEGLMWGAHFHTALAMVQATRELLDEEGALAQLASRRARLEVQAATGELALGERARARQSMIRALQADPALDLDARDTSPKLLELLRQARRHAVAAEPLR